MAKAGFGAVIVSGWTKTIIFIVVAPMIGLTVGLLLMTAIFWIVPRCAPPSRVDRWFRRLQLLSAAAYSLMHGANDAQKTMGIITGALVDGRLPDDVSRAVLGRVIVAHTAIGLGTLSGGWRIIKTMGIEDHEAAAGRAASRPRPAPRWRSTRRRPWASASARPTRSRAPSSASARRGG